eukprot:g20301.t1
MLASGYTGMAQAADPLKIGASLPLTGGFSIAGQKHQQGYELCVDLINERGGIMGRQVELLVSDNRSDPATAINQYERFINVDGVEAVYGTFSSRLSFPVASILAKNNMVHPLPAGGALRIYTQGHKNIFYFQPNAAEYVGASLAGIIKDLIPVGETPKTAAVISADDFFANGVWSGLMGEKVMDPADGSLVRDLAPGYLAENNIEVVFSERWPEEGFSDWLNLANQVLLEGQRIEHLRPHKITRMGLSRTFQISRNLADMTVLENVICQSRIGGWRDLFKPALGAEEVEKAMEILDFLGITRIAYEDGFNLSYGQKKLMDLAALLMSDPKIILLDEPAGGVNPTLLEEIIGHIQKLNEQGLTVLIVEHNMDLIMRLSHKIVVMAQGKVIADGKPEEVRENPAVLDAYLGKSTLLKAICGMLKVRNGDVLYKGESLKGLRPDQVLRKGICFVPQERALFPKMTVRENMRMGGFSMSDKSGLEKRIDEIEELFPILKERRDKHAGTMSGGQQQTLAMARTMILKPDIVMLDEPSLGLAPKIVQEMFSIMKMMAAEGITILLVEQNALMGLKNSDQGVVLDLGRTLFSGPADDVLRDPRIQDLYLGGKKAA